MIFRTMTVRSIPPAVHRLLGVLIFVLWLLPVLRLSGAEATGVSSITTRSGFSVELLRSAQEGEDSWISMTFDQRGRIVVGLDRVGVGRITLGKDPSPTRFERIEDSLKHCRGVLWANDSLYVVATYSREIYRLRDLDQDDQFEEARKLFTVAYHSRYGHGANQIVQSPAGWLYVVVGNDVRFPKGSAENSPYRNPQKDWLLPNPQDVGHDNRVGYILRMDADGKARTIVAGGFRNQVDMAFNSEGEMFTFDADMELDVGLPWYRPTRVNHIVSGGEYGWRWGTGKWPVYYEDSLPTTLDCGLGSPTGLLHGSGGNLPARYRDSILMADWQNGRILAVDFMARGASYEAKYESFLEGAPLNVCDMAFGPQGDLYFITGGRGSQSGLYRLRWDGTNIPFQKADASAEAKTQRNLRRRLEVFHRKQDAAAIDFIWPHLDSQDRWLRFAARIALENQDVTLWRQRALTETRVTAAITALIGLARQGKPADRDLVLTALQRIETSRLTRTQWLALLRAYQLCFIRLGAPEGALYERVVNRLEPLFPDASSSVNHLLGEILVFLRAESVVAKTTRLLNEGWTQQEQIRYAQLLVRARGGWSAESRQAMFQWLQRTHLFHGDNLLRDAISAIRTDFIESLTEIEREQMSDEIAALEQPRAVTVEKNDRPLVQHWTLQEVIPSLDQVASNRSYSRGWQALLDASCLKCHRVGESGGQIGPDLTNVGRRFDERAILQSILEPSRVIDPKYQYTAHILVDGKVVIGRPAQVNSEQIKIETNPLTAEMVTVDRINIDETYPAKISPMPNGLVDILEREEILDLIAVLKSGGNLEDAAFQQ